jgi:hypothetical protein
VTQLIQLPSGKTLVGSTGAPLLYGSNPNLLLYSGLTGVRNPILYYDLSGPIPVNYQNTSNLQSGHPYNLDIRGSAASYPYWLPACNFPSNNAGGTDGFDRSGYTQLMVDLFPTTGSSSTTCVAEIHDEYCRAINTDITNSTHLGYAGVTNVTGALTVGAWNKGLLIPFCYLGGLSAYNFYKFLFQTASFDLLLDNVYWVPGNVGWIYRGNSSLESGWTDASTYGTGGSVNYGWLPNTLNSALYAINNAPYYNAYATGEVSGSTLIISGTVGGGTIKPGMHVFTAPSGTAGSDVGAGAIVSGSGSSWTMSGSATVASQPLVFGIPQASVCGTKLTTTIANGVWYAKNLSGFNLNPYNNFTFGAIPTKSGYSYQVQAYNASQVAIGSPVTATTPQDMGISTTEWTMYNIPLSSLGINGQTIYGISIKDLSGQSSNVIYLGAMGFWS